MSDARIAIMSTGMWELSDILAVASGCRLVRWRFGLGAWRCDAIGGWGHKITAGRARLAAQRLNLPYIAFEDGWLRSVNAGSSERPRSLVVDRSGIYYDAHGPSDLESLIADSAANEDRERVERARRGIALLRDQAVSKYNSGPWLADAQLGIGAAPGRARVLVVDQTCGDASVELGCSSAQTFRDMLAAAERENPGAEIIVKIHPEVVSGRKAGYLADVDRNRYTVVDVSVNPWALIEAVDRVYVVTSQLGFESLLAEKRVTCFGAPFYAGWGLTDDRIALPRRTARPSLEQLFAAAYFDYAVYVDPATGKRVSFEETVAALVDERGRIECSRPEPSRLPRTAADVGLVPLGRTLSPA
jgi:capsular polysaccharide export protein